MKDVSVPLDDIHACALRIGDGADEIRQMTWPAIDSNDLSGSAVGVAAADPWLPTTVLALVADMRGWAAAARTSAVAATDADARVADGLPAR